MTVTRADTITQNTKQAEYFSDFLDSFASSPYSGNLAKVTNENSVRQSVKNLVLTNIGERFFQPNVGTNVNKSLFEPNDITTVLDLQLYIENVIRYYEKRVKELHVSVIPSENDSYLIVNIIFSIINNPNPIDLTLNLKRVR